MMIPSGSDLKNKSASSPFLTPPLLRDNDLLLSLARTTPADPGKKHVPGYLFLMVHLPDRAIAGVVSLRIGNPETDLYFPGQIGYRVRKTYRGRHYAERSLKLILPFARKHGWKSLWISCRPDNAASRKCCEHNGGKLHEMTGMPEWHEMYGQGYRQICRYVIDL